MLGSLKFDATAVVSLTWLGSSWEHPRMWWPAAQPTTEHWRCTPRRRGLQLHSWNHLENSAPEKHVRDKKNHYESGWFKIKIKKKFGRNREHSLIFITLWPSHVFTSAKTNSEKKRQKKGGSRKQYQTEKQKKNVDVFSFVHTWCQVGFLTSPKTASVCALNGDKQNTRSWRGPLM